MHYVHCYSLRLSYELRSRSTASLPMSFAHLCALLTQWPAATYGLWHLCTVIRCAYFMAYGHYALRLWHPCLFFKPRPAAQLTFYQQPQKVSKKGRSPTNFLIHIFNRLQCQAGERKHPCKAIRLVQTSMSGHLTSRRKIWKIGVVTKLKAATSSPKSLAIHGESFNWTLLHS